MTNLHDDIKAFAKQAIRQEIAKLQAMLAKMENSQPNTRRKRSPLTAAQRKAISKRMRGIWAQRKAAAAAGRKSRKAEA